MFTKTNYSKFVKPRADTWSENKPIQFELISRVEVIDNAGRSYVNNEVEWCNISIQDNGKTLKIFVK